MDDIVFAGKVVTPLSGAFNLPYSKSMYNRALAMGLASGRSFSVSAKCDAEDGEVIYSYLKALQYDIWESSDGAIHFSPTVFPSDVHIDLKMAGTAMRFLSAVACTLPVVSHFTGATRLSDRPIQALRDALVLAGAEMEYAAVGYALPVRILGNPNWSPPAFTLTAAESSQMLSALLLLGPSLEIGTRIWISQSSIVSRPYAEMTLRMLSQQGIVWEADDLGFVLKHKQWKDQVIQVERDWSSASYAFAWAIVFPSDFLIPGLYSHSLQGDSTQVAHFEKLGLQLKFESQGLRVRSKGHSRIPAFHLSFQDIPDLAQTFAVLALLGDGPCTLSGLHTLAVKETDRIEALRHTLSSLGACVTVEDYSMEITPVEKLLPGNLDTFDDHRMAMSLSILMSLMPGDIGLLAPGVVSKSFPSFWEQLQAIGIKIIK
jgi:3-phosphoshikimate 1-carboxyvinyltransferase